MLTIAEIYRENLEILIKEAGSLQALATKLDRSSAQLSQWRNGSPDKNGKPRTPSRASVRRIEERCGKPVGWMDQHHPEIKEEPPSGKPEKGAVYKELSPPEKEMIDNWRYMSDTDRAELAPEIARRAEVFQSNMSKAVIDGRVKLPFRLTRGEPATTTSEPAKSETE